MILTISVVWGCAIPRRRLTKVHLSIGQSRLQHPTGSITGPECRTFLPSTSRHSDSPPPFFHARPRQRSPNTFTAGRVSLSPYRPHCLRLIPPSISRPTHVRPSGISGLQHDQGLIVRGFKLERDCEQFGDEGYAKDRFERGVERGRRELFLSNGYHSFAWTAQSRC
jgi:hypothetical protein